LFPLMKNAPSIAKHVSRARAQRMVDLGRLLVAAFALVAAAVGVLRRGEGAGPLAILAFWTAVAGLVVARTHRQTGARPLPLVAVLDIVVIGGIVLTTGGIASPFFPMLVLPPYTASLLYSRRALTWTIAAGVAVYAAALLTTHDAADPQMMIMRLAVAVLLALGVVRRTDYDERVQSDLEHLATWPRGLAGHREENIREQLERAAGALRAPRAALLWQESDGTFLIATVDLEKRAFDLDEDEPAAVVDPALEEASAFLQQGGRTLRSTGGTIESLREPALTPAFAAALCAESVVGARFTSPTASGWLLALDPRSPDADQMMLAEIIARLVSAGLDQFNVAEMNRRGAAANERLRLSRDLHDGLLQSLGGLALHAQAARRAATADPQAAAGRLGDMVTLLTEAQGSLRDFVDELRPDLPLRRESLSARLERVASAVASQWAVPVHFEMAGDDSTLDPALAAEVTALMAEALANAAKHSGASRIDGRVRVERDAVHIEVGDDGRGFPFAGRYDLPQLVAEERGPWSLKERVAAHGGSLVIESSSSGARVALRLPLAS
jgi:signal transduction histidine kinase